jgi:hypothetical protein
MNVQRGDVLKARFPHASGERGKKRPVVVVSASALVFLGAVQQRRPAQEPEPPSGPLVIQQHRLDVFILREPGVRQLEEHRIVAGSPHAVTLASIESTLQIAFHGGVKRCIEIVHVFQPLTGRCGVGVKIKTVLQAGFRSNGHSSRSKNC